MTKFHRVTDSISARPVTPRRRMIQGVFLVLFAALILSFAAGGFPSAGSTIKVTQPRASASALAAPATEGHESDSAAQSAAVTAEQSESDPMIPQAPAGHPELLLQFD